MELTMMASPEIFDQALKAARNAGQSKYVRGLAASLDASLLGRIEETWDSIEIALRQGYQFGKEKAQSMLEAAIAKSEQLVKEAGTKGREVHRILTEKLRAYQQEFISSALSRFPSLVELGGTFIHLPAGNRAKCSRSGRTLIFQIQAEKVPVHL